MPAKRMDVHSLYKQSYDDIDCTKVKCKNNKKMPIYLLPNCASYEGDKQPLSMLDALFGIIRRSGKQGGSIIG